ncbi:MAG: phosphoenolpyruvate--protein phosphotransferase [Gammaproteobacteria bacterium]|nr:MAG: phosphoenolpyruvate--protein phosphotransferase [Gammaproteobacteria bacterium]
MLEVLRSIVQEVNSAEDQAQALAIIVRRIRDAMGTEVCSVYMRDTDTQRYVFQATQGLNAELVGNFSFAEGEGLVGMVAEREEPVNLEDAAKHPNFKFVEGVGEERYRAFLGVPIVHQRQVLGVLVVQQACQRRFDESEEAFLITMSAQLASIIAVTRVATPSRGRPVTERLSGIPGAPGIAIGCPMVMLPRADLFAVPQRNAQSKLTEMRAFRRALGRVREDIESVSANLRGKLNAEDHALFDVYLGILDDSSIGKEVAGLISQGQWAQGALSEVMIRHIRHFEAMEHSYLQERAVDVKDLGERMLSYLQQDDPKRLEFPDNAILVGEELTASMLGEIPVAKLAGMISVKGSGNSHLAIMARAMGVPTVMGVEGLSFKRLSREASLIVDGHTGLVCLNPTQQLIDYYSEALAEEVAVSKELECLRDLPCETRDQVRMPLLVNTGLMADVDRSLRQGAEGVGLYRTEVPFLMRERFPSEEEQREVYSGHLQSFAPLPVTMRTLDIGGDKALPYFPIDEENPFLGWRGIRVTLDHPELFLGQVRAMLKASEGFNNLRVMMPMISNTAELDEALTLYERAVAEVQQEGFAIERAPVGVMMEVPAAVYQARALARRVDFLSVGSNDLTQYLLAVDRNNARVASLYNACHPAVLRALYDIAKAARAEGRPVSICGELAGDPKAAPLLLAMGYDGLSMNATSLTRVKKMLRSISKAQADALLEEVLTLEDGEQVQAVLIENLNRLGLEQLIYHSVLPPG